MMSANAYSFTDNDQQTVATSQVFTLDATEREGVPYVTEVPSAVRFMRSGMEDLPVHAEPASTLTRFAKRALDVVASSLALVALSPVFLAIAILIKWKTPGDVIFKHERAGLNGKPFTCYKFRTMVPNAHWILEKDETLRDSFHQTWKLVEDPRVTSVGRILRKTSLDELPQLWNVLKGDMSLVGPRPVPEEELLQQYADYARTVTMVRPGMTGLWQISGRSNLAYEERVKLDVHYVRQLTLWFDILIILRTIPALLGSKDAY